MVATAVRGEVGGVCGGVWGFMGAGHLSCTGRGSFSSFGSLHRVVECMHVRMSNDGVPRFSLIHLNGS